MARPNKKAPEEWRTEILDSALKLFLSKGYEETTVSDIMNDVGGAKGMFYHFFQSKGEVMHVLGNQLFFENNPFTQIKGRDDLNGLEKIKTLLRLNAGDTKRTSLNLQAVPILKDPHILAAAVEENRRILTPLWLDLLEEGLRDGSIQTDYPKELAELLPLINFWLMPSVFPATEAELRHKYHFVMRVLNDMGLPFSDDEITAHMEAFIAALFQKGDCK